MKEPTYAGKKLTTTEGGFITTDELRIQGKEVALSKAHGDTVINAKTHIAFLYKGHLLTADTLQYNITKKCGSATNVSSTYNIYAITAEKGIFHSDGTVTFENALLHPEDGLKTLFSLRAKKVRLFSDNQLIADSVYVHTAQIPVLYLPEYRYSLKKEEVSPFSYGLRWITGQGPEFSLQYTLFHNENTSISFRGDIRPSRGLGAAFETYKKTNNGFYKTRSYLSHDTFYRSNTPEKKITRYRLQGELFSEREDSIAKARVKYDIFNDRTMPEDFPSPYFEYDAVELNKIDISFKTPYGMLGIRGLPKLNSFQGYAQEIPSAYFRLTPSSFGHLLVNNAEKLSYYRYTPAKNIASSVASYDAIRFSSNTELTGSLPVPYVRITPYLGYIFNAYSQGEKRLSLAATYGGAVDLPLRSSEFELVPFVSFTGITTPTSNTSSHPIFSVDDGIDTYRLLKSGIHSRFFQSETTAALSLYTMSFVNQDAIGKKFVQKGVAKGVFTTRCITCRTEALWNFEEDALDLFSFDMQGLLTERLGLSFLYMYRGNYYYRKDERSQFILDANTSSEELVQTTLSDRRNLACAKMQYNITDTLRFQGRLHAGFGRRNAPGYTEGFGALIQRLSTHIDGSIHVGRTTRGIVGYGSIKMVY